MVRIQIDYDVVAIPYPVGAAIVVVRRRLKEEPAHVETLTSAAMQPPDMLWSDRSAEASMLPWVIEVIVNVVPSRVVPDPVIVFGLHVRHGWMPRHIMESLPLLGLGV